VKAIVSQVGSLDYGRKRWPCGRGVRPGQLAYESNQKSAWELGYPAPRARVIGNLQGGPIRDHLLLYAPVEDAGKLKNCAALFIVAEKEELFDNKDHAKLADDRMPGPKKYVEVPGITHYGIYTTARDQAIKLAIEWFGQYLKK
jgi:hypothetical protein